MTFGMRADRLGLAGSMGLTLLASLCFPGCMESHHLVSYPPDTLTVPYEPATSYSACLVASVAMAANYLENNHRFTASQIMADVRAAKGEESRIGDVQQYLAGKGLHLLALAGKLNDEPEHGLGFWVKTKGYPAICIINRAGENPAFNHAVVVIGMQHGVDSAEIIQYLDPSADQPLYTSNRAAFDTTWSRSGHAMLVVVKPPAEGLSGSAHATADPAGVQNAVRAGW